LYAVQLESGLQLMFGDYRKTILKQRFIEIGCDSKCV